MAGSFARRLSASALTVAVAVSFSADAVAQDRVYLGPAYAVSNDSIGQFRDRWQSSFLMGSLFFGPDVPAPQTLSPGRLLEVRLSHQLVTPERLDAPEPGDRPFGGAFAVELLTHGHIGAAEVSFGAGLAVTGPQTRTFRAQRWLHERLGYPLPRPDGREVADAVHPVVSTEIARSFGQGLRIRPFVEARAGLETLLRTGADLTWGPDGTSRAMVREPVTGHRLPALWGPREEGFSLTLGADVAAVEYSAFLSDDGLTPEPRLRMRAGLRWQGAVWSLTYGATWLSPEFEGQREGQVVGVVQVGAAF